MNQVQGSLLASKSDWDFIKQNKPNTHNQLTLQLALFLGYLRNGEEWISQDCYSTVSGVKSIAWEDVTVSVLIDQHCVYQGTPIDECLISHQITDDADVEHTVEIVLQGLTYDHCPVWPVDNSHGGLALKVSGKFENIPWTMLTSNFGEYLTENNKLNVATDILGQNGIQRWSFTSPFYQWLHQRREKIIWQLTYPHGYQPI
jgi:hypothetical protein